MNSNEIPQAAEAALQALLTVIYQQQCVKYIIVAGLTFLVYDMCINFDQEVQYIWQSKWSFPKCLYIFIRYYGPVWTIIIFSGFMTHHLNNCNH
ncbi:hypothetical protein FB446DRAFT_748813 [Lentinula raphanica]|nr:hypothetical protein FB446DRAFT_748813 [Lentinula raphanica]